MLRDGTQGARHGSRNALDTVGASGAVSGRIAQERGFVCEVRGGAVEISGAPIENPCRARSGAVWGLGGCHFELVAAHDDGRRCLNVR